MEFWYISFIIIVVGFLGYQYGKYASKSTVWGFRDSDGYSFESGKSAYETFLKIKTIMKAKRDSENLNLSLEKRIIELEEVLFILSEVLHEEYILNESFTYTDISELMKSARLFTRYSNNTITISSLEDNPYKDKNLEFIEYLEKELWLKIYGNKFKSLIKKE